MMDYFLLISLNFLIFLYIEQDSSLSYPTRPNLAR